MSKFSRIANFTRLVRSLALSLPLVASKAMTAWAEGAPQEWSLNLQNPGSLLSAEIGNFHNILLVIIFAISIFVLLLLVYVSYRFRQTRNPVPSTTTHNLKLEIIWTAIPTAIILFIAVIAFPLLYKIDRMPTPDLTLKITGHQWYWSYEYPDQNGIAFDSQPIWNSPDVTPAQAEESIKDAEKGWLIHEEPRRLLEVDNRVVLPVGKVVRVQITAGDVLHSWFVPSLGMNRMAVVGRLNEVWFKIDHEGLYFGECSMICGNGHGYMPIVVEGVSPDKFKSWVAAKKTASNGFAPISYADAGR